MHPWFNRILILAILIANLAAGPSRVPAASLPAARDALIKTYRQRILAMMPAEGVTGAAIAVVDGQAVVWAEGFGYTDNDHSRPVTAETLFSIQSMSKSFTALGALFAAQDGLVDLDTPITTYLPDFRLDSIFETNPQEKITLRRLLSHTAGLTHEAPLGSNFDLPAGTFEQHVASISNTWLRYPVGQRYGYSNLGIDLAGYILQVRAGKPFAQYEYERVLAPLGMAASTFDSAEIQRRPDRATGHTDTPFKPPVKMLIVPSGGLYTSASDMANYLRFFLAQGAPGGERLLRADLLESMYSPPNRAAQQAGYGLGVAISTRNHARRIQHGGGGFGFNSSMVWYPELQLGLVLLTNAEDNALISDLPDEILDAIIAADPQVYTARQVAATTVKPAYPMTPNDPLLGDYALEMKIASKALPDDPAAQARRASYAGEYIALMRGLPILHAQIKTVDGGLKLESELVAGRLYEVQPGLFFDPQGEAVRLGGRHPTYRNIPLVKVNPALQPLRLGFFGSSGLAFLALVVGLPAASLVRRLRRRPAVPASRPERWTARLAWLGALLSLGVVGFLLAVPDLMAVPWPPLYRDLRLYELAGMGLPYAGLALGLLAAAGLIWSWRQVERRPARLVLLLAALLLVAFNLAVII